MKRIILPALLAVFSSAAFAHEGHEHGKSPAKPVTLTGEVVDLTCYLQHPETATGADHAKCAKSCIKQGNPIGFLADNGTVYILIGDDHEPVAAKVVEHAGARSTITGVVVEHHGVKGIELATITAAVAGAKAAARPGGLPNSAPLPKSGTASAVTYYTCSMHPEIHQKTPGECPKCGMSLVPEKTK